MNGFVFRLVNKKPLTLIPESAVLGLSGWWDSNPRPRRPERRALAGLRHIPNCGRDYNGRISF